MNDDFWRSNQTAFETRSAANWYAAQPLAPAEALIFLLHAETIRGGHVLDLAVGSGRTTRYLLPLATRYVAIDRSKSMRERLAQDFPEADVRDTDLRALDDLGEDKFDFILASCGIMDAFTHSDRLAALKAIRERLAPGGLFVFSAHNRDHAEAGRGPSIPSWSRANPLRALDDTLHFARNWWNFRRLRHLRREEPEYGILNDRGHDWTLVLYHMSAPAQLRQLSEAAFELVEAFSDEGDRADPSQPITKSVMIHYVARAA